MALSEVSAFASLLSVAWVSSVYWVNTIWVSPSPPVALSEVSAFASLLSVAWVSSVFNPPVSLAASAAFLCPAPAFAPLFPPRQHRFVLTWSVDVASSISAGAAAARGASATFATFFSSSIGPSLAVAVFALFRKLPSSPWPLVQPPEQAVRVSPSAPSSRGNSCS